MHEVFENAAAEVALWDKWARDGRPVSCKKETLVAKIKYKLDIFADVCDEWCEVHHEDDALRKLAKSLRRKAKTL